MEKDVNEMTATEYMARIHGDDWQERDDRTARANADRARLLDKSAAYGRAARLWEKAEESGYFMRLWFAFRLWRLERKYPHLIN